jgi:hypothetical protein
VVEEEGEKGGLEVRAGAVGLDAFEAVAFELGLAGGAADEVRRHIGAMAQVFDGAGHSGDWDVLAVGDWGPSSSPTS